MGQIIVRAATPADVPGMARVHVQAWQETYRGMGIDDELDDPGFIERRKRTWTLMLSDPRFTAYRIAVAEHGGEIVGIAQAGPSRDDDAAHPWQLYVLYLLAAHHGSGAGQRMLDAVLGDEPSVLWVADPNPRAQAFYRRNGFVADGRELVDGLREIRMVRG
ncbi:GNAT family N-acetyltransferase [Gryllotalpicola ginsengisoli]|uniref:GNAT family N-acetyltransferase n=1 Tax=Gryllotalpicola ginsengisoli TaxID=444608 RepID=UPI0003F5632F|nr:GNAT family N-acetyltransferase [Gryllotalpicola ginsengisoli]